MKKGLTLLAYLGLVITSALFVPSCSKDDAPKPKPTALTKEQSWSKEIYDIMEEVYLWNDALPTSFDPTKYATPEDALKYLKELKINPATKNPIDRYSFLDKIGGLTGEIGEGQSSGDYGFMILPALNEKGEISFYVNYVYKDSPAGKAGINRSYEIIQVNGSNDVHPAKKDATHLDTQSSGFINVINAVFRSSNATFKFKKTDGTTLETTLTVASYKFNSVLFDQVYTIDSKKIGYLVFNYFLEAPSLVELRSTFSKFENEGISELIVDLRYNGGGSVTTCDTLSSIIAPASTDGKIMKYTIYNKLLDGYFTSKYGSDYTTTKFKKEGGIALNRIFFIVSNSTASASELLINNLKPYMEVKLIGENSYGKPCGFFGIPVGYDRNQTTPKEGYDLYAISFETVNANREGRYYTGMTVDKEERDGFWCNWGDSKEPCLAQALNYIQNSTFKATTKSATRTLKADIDRQFKGMIDFRKHLK